MNPDQAAIRIQRSFRRSRSQRLVSANSLGAGTITEPVDDPLVADVPELAEISERGEEEEDLEKGSSAQSEVEEEREQTNRGRWWGVLTGVGIVVGATMWQGAQSTNPVDEEDAIAIAALAEGGGGGGGGGGTAAAATGTGTANQ